MMIQAAITCPHCGRQITLEVQAHAVTSQELQRCDEAQGGCGRVLMVRIAPHFSVTAHRADGTE